MFSRTTTRRAARTAAGALLLAAAGGAAAPAAQAKLERVDVFTARLTMTVHHQAHEHEGGWSQVDSTSDLLGTIHARVDGLVFIDGVPQQANSAFTAANTTDIALTQQASYKSPYGSQTGTCDEMTTESRPETLGQIGTSIGANAADGSPQLQIGVQSPGTVWVEKHCSGYLKYEVADPLLADPVFQAQYVPITETRGSFSIPLKGVPACPNFIRIVNCVSTYEGAVEFEQTASYLRGEPDPELPVPPAPKPPPAGAPDSAYDAFIIKLMVRRAREDRYGQAVVRCGKPCQGEVSAYAIALSKQGKPKGTATKLGSAKFRSSDHGEATTRVPLSRADRKQASKRGAIEYRVEGRPLTGGDAVRASTYLRVR